MNIPAKINLINEVLPLLVFMAETNRYIPIKARNNPSGSDLNHPITPLKIIGIDMANIKDATRPAVVPPMTRTNANTATDVNEPMITGNITTKS